MDEKDIDVYELFRKYDKKKKNSLKEDDFDQLLLSLNPKLGKAELSNLFCAFDSNRNKEIEFNEFYTKLCKIGETVKI